MNLIEIILVSIGLAMDAFAVSVCKGLSIRKVNLNKIVIIGGYFGLFQGLMPMIGFFLGNIFGNIIVSVDHWVAFILLIMIGYNMLRDAFSKESDSSDDRVDFKAMFPLAIATSIDALAVGITLAFLKVNIIKSIFIIGIITFLISCFGVKVGNVFGNKYEKKAQMIGGVILIFMGIKILIEHLGLI